MAILDAKFYVLSVKYAIMLELIDNEDSRDNPIAKMLDTYHNVAGAPCEHQQPDDGLPESDDSDLDNPFWISKSATFDDYDKYYRPLSDLLAYLTPNELYESAKNVPPDERLDIITRLLSEKDDTPEDNYDCLLSVGDMKFKKWDEYWSIVAKIDKMYGFVRDGKKKRIYCKLDSQTKYTISQMINYLLEVDEDKPHYKSVLDDLLLIRTDIDKNAQNAFDAANENKNKKGRFNQSNMNFLPYFRSAAEKKIPLSELVKNT